MLILGKFLFPFIFLSSSVFDKSVSLYYNNKSTDVMDMISYLQHFNNQFYQFSSLTIIQSVQHKSAKFYFHELLNEYSKLLNDTKIMVKNVQSDYQHSFDYFNIMFIDSYESFRKIDPGTATTTEDFSEYYLIIYYAVSPNPEQAIQKIFDYCWHYYTVNVALILKPENEKPVNLYTYYPFTQKLCKKCQLQIINENNSILELRAAQLFPNKFKNFHNCSLMAALWHVPPYIVLPAAENYSKKLAGIEGSLLEILAKTLQFRIDYITPPNNEQRGLIKANGLYTGAIKMLNERVADVSLGSFGCTPKRSTVLSASSSFYQSSLVLTVLSLQRPWTSLEIIAYPFQVHIWIVFLLLLLLIQSSTYVLHYYKTNILKFIFGFSSVNYINMNIISMALNQAISALPKNNFARHIILMWIFLTMILRSIYQGALYDFLKSQQHIKPPNTVAELRAKNFSLIVNVATNDTIANAKMNLVIVLAMNIGDTGGFAILEANPYKNYVTGGPKDFLTYYVKINNKYGVFHVLNENIFSQQLCIYFSKHSYLTNIFNDVLLNLKKFGIIDHLANNLLNNRFEEPNNKKLSNETPLTLNQLLGIVEISLCLYLLAVVVFICELFFSKHLKK